MTKIYAQHVEFMAGQKNIPKVEERSSPMRSRCSAIHFAVRAGILCIGAIFLLAEAAYGSNFFSAKKDCSLGPCTVNYTYSKLPATQFILPGPQTVKWETLYAGTSTTGRRFTLNGGAITLSSDVTVTSAGTTALPAGTYTIDITTALMGPGTYTVSYDRAQIAVSPSTWPYGSFKATIATPHTFAVQNVGEVPVTISSVVSSDPVHFTISGVSIVGQTIAPGASKSLQVTFNPGTVKQSYNGTITINATSSAQPVSAVVTVSGTSLGDPHVTTVDGVHYDLQSVGEFVLLRQTNDFEIQVRHTPVPSGGRIADPYDSLTNCVSINTAVATRLGQDRVTVQPSLDGMANPRGLQVRVNGVLTALDASGLNLESGGRIFRLPSGESYQLESPNGAVIQVTAAFWSGQGWYINVEVFSAPVVQPVPQGIMAPLASKSWLPALPDGTSVGPMPDSLHERFVQLHEKFANAWRVSDSTTLFDYAAGTSTKTFTDQNWPAENGFCAINGSNGARPVTKEVAEALCKDIVDDHLREKAVWDIRVTGHVGFADLYKRTEQNVIASTSTILYGDKQTTFIREPSRFTAVVIPRALTNVPLGHVQFFVDGKQQKTIKLDSRGSAVWKTTSLKSGRHYMTAKYLPARRSYSSSISRWTAHDVVSETKDKKGRDAANQQGSASYR